MKVARIGSFCIPDNNNFNKGHRLLMFCVGSQKDTSEMFSSFRTLPGMISIIGPCVCLFFFHFCLLID